MCNVSLFHMLVISLYIYMRCDDVQCFSVSYACNKSIHI